MFICGYINSVVSLLEELVCIVLLKNHFLNVLSGFGYLESITSSSKFTIPLFQDKFLLFSVCKEPPYHVSEKGYASFELPIKIHFRNKAEPRTIDFNYNLLLHMQEPVNHSRCEKLTFQNPTDEFKKKLIKAGGVSFLCFHFKYAFKNVDVFLSRVFTGHQ